MAIGINDTPHQCNCRQSSGTSIKVAKEIVKQYGLKSKVKFGSGKAFADYKPEQDTIYLRNSYPNLKEYYKTVLHEIHHALMTKQLGAK